MRRANWTTIMCQLFVSLAALLLAPLADAAVIAFTSFENETIGGTSYLDTGSADSDHDLVNNSGDLLVDSTVAGSGAAGDLRFNARIVNTRGPGLTDGDEVGVTNTVDDVGAYTHGSQGYKFQDTDDRMILDFDPVSIVAPTKVEIDYFVTETEYEQTSGVTDSLRILLTINGSTVVPIIDTTGSDIDNLGIEGRWIRGTAELTSLGTSAVLSVAVDTDSAAEEVYIDRIIFTSVPEPTSILLAAAVAISWAALRRHRS